MPRLLLMIVPLAFLVVSQAGPNLVAEPVDAGSMAESTIGALAANFPTESDEVRVAIWFGIASDELEAGKIEASATLLSKQARSEGAAVDGFTVAGLLDAEFLEDRSRLQIYGDLLAPPGDYLLVLEIHAHGGSSRAEYAMVVDQLSSDRPSVMPPFFLDDEGVIAALYEVAALVEVTDDGGAPDPTKAPADYPFRAAGEFFIPDISPRVTEEMPRSRICLIGRKLTDDKTFLETGLVAQDDIRLSKERLAVVSQDDADSMGLETLCLGLDTQGLEGGLYQLNITLHDFERQTTESTAMSFEIEKQPDSP